MKINQNPYTKNPNLNPDTANRSDKSQDIKTRELGIQDQYSPGNKPVDAGNYSKPDVSTIERLKAESEARFQGLRDMVRELLERQGMNFRDVDAGEVVKVDEETRMAAQEAISEDGEFGVAAVSDRIVEFAKAISGGDKSKFDKLVGAIEEGFEAAKEALGGELPEISQQTYDAVMEKLEAWRDEEASAE